MHPARTVKKAVSKVTHYIIRVTFSHDAMPGVIQKKTGEWGVPYPGEASELLRTDMKVSPLPSPPLENFTIGLDKTASGCTLHMDWETTRASVDIAEGAK